MSQFVWIDGDKEFRLLFTYSTSYAQSLSIINRASPDTHIFYSKKNRSLFRMMMIQESKLISHNKTYTTKFEHNISKLLTWVTRWEPKNRTKQQKNCFNSDVCGCITNQIPLTAELRWKLSYATYTPRAVYLRQTTRLCMRIRIPVQTPCSRARPCLCVSHCMYGNVISKMLRATKITICRMLCVW